MTNEEFDNIIRQKLHQFEAPVSEDLWNKIHMPIPSPVSTSDYSFDNFVKNKLVHLAAPVPPGLWDKVKPKEEKRRRIFFFLPRTSIIAASILLLVLAGSVSAYLYYKKIHPIAIADNSASGNAGLNYGGIILQKKSLLGSSKQPDDKSTIEVSKKQPLTNERTVLLNTRNGISPTTSSPSQKQEKHQIFGLNSTSTINSTGAVFAQKNLFAEEDIEIVESYSTAEKAGKVFVKADRNHYNANSKKSIAYFKESNQLKNIIICPSDRKSRNTDWDLEVYLGPDYAAKSVISNNATPQFLSRKDSSETAGISYSAGFRIVKPINDHFSIKTGLNFTQINEKFSYRSENEIKTTTIVTQRIIIRAPGDTITISDTSTLQQIGFKNNHVKNRYRSIDIPILFGYQFGDDDLRIGINAGVMVNLTSWYQGMIFDSSFTPQTVNKSSDMVYKKNIGLGLYAGLSFMKRLNYNTHIFAEPYFRYNLSDMNMPGSAYKQRFSIGGLSLGLRFNLNQR